MTGLGVPTSGTPRRLLVLAAILAVFSLGLPWVAAKAGTWTAGTFVPSYCSTIYTYNGVETECTAPQYYPGYTGYGTAAQPGYATEVRVWLVIAVILLIIGLRRSDRRLQLTGLTVGALGLVTAPGALGGQLTYLAALLMVWAAISSRASLPTLGRGGVRGAHSG